VERGPSARTGVIAEPTGSAHVQAQVIAPADHLNALFIGRNWGGFYKARFDRFIANGGRFEATWNWAAAFAPGWFLYRKLWLAFFAWAALGYLLMVLAGALVPLGPGAASVAWLFATLAVVAAQGLSGNFLLFRRGQRLIADVTSVYDAPQARAAEVARRGGVAAWVPWVIGAVWVLAVVVGIGAAILIPDFANTKDKAYVAGMKADLRNLVTAQEAYYADNVTYSHTISNLNYSVSAGNQIVITEASGTGWSATATSTGTSKTCGIFVGAATPPVMGQSEGAPVCQ